MARSMPRPIHLSRSDISRSECIACMPEQRLLVAAVMPRLATCITLVNSVTKLAERADVLMTHSEELIKHEMQSQLM